MIYLEEKKLAYVPIPKNACTTIKHSLYRLQNNREFQRFQAGHRTFYIHTVMNSKTYEHWSSMGIINEIRKSDTFIFTVVRNPLSRLLSGYKNRVLFHNDIGKDARAYEKCKKAGLPEKPDINTFVENLSFYQKNCPSILHHTQPQVTFLGHDPNFYSKIYPINKINSELWVDLSKIAGETIPVPPKKLQTGGSNLSIDELTSENIAYIEDLYAADYKFLEGIII